MLEYNKLENLRKSFSLKKMPHQLEYFNYFYWNQFVLKCIFF